MTSLGIDLGGTSIKAAVLRDGALLWTRRSAAYERPSRAELVSALREATAGCGTLDHIGLCVPGLLDRDRRVVTVSVNVPCLSGMSLDALLADALGSKVPTPSLLTDAHAAAFDLYSSRRLTGRLLLLVLGAGVGAAVYDETGPLRVDGESPGHFGQLDVSVENAPVIGPDGGGGSLEGYLGAAALHRAYGDDFVSRLDIGSPPLRALARAIRIGHAIYRPHHVCLAGGIGLALQPLLEPLRQAICLHLTHIARDGWTLTCGDDGFHAAIGSARIGLNLYKSIDL